MRRTVSLRSLFLLALFAAAARPAAAQEEPAAEQWERPYSLSIQDNSFFLEEAFNQEEGVVQHISAGSLFRKPFRALGYTFTQEWPVGGVKHQLSYDLAYASIGAADGLGDVSVSYRYQLLDKPDGIALAPRVSVIVPTGDETKGLGLGSAGAELGLPASKRLSELFVAHANLAAAIFPDVKVPTAAGTDVRRAVTAYTLGGSLVWLFHPNVNLLLEGVSVVTSEPDEAANMRFVTVHVVSPGVRAALNFGGLQVVPGIAVPVRFRDGGSETGIFGYLSLEHAY